MTRVQQLALPGLGPAPSPLVRAKRDMNAHELARALGRHGLELIAGGCVVAEAASGRSVCFAECVTNPLRIRRATLAKALRTLKGKS